MIGHRQHVILDEIEAWKTVENGRRLLFVEGKRIWACIVAQQEVNLDLKVMWPCCFLTADRLKLTVGIFLLSLRASKPFIDTVQSII